MDETLRQIGELLLGSIPTIIFFVLLFGLYVVIVHKPLARVLAERHARTQGAIEKARADIATAEVRTAEYEKRLREARLALFKAQEARRARAAQARAEAVADARKQAQAQIEQARAMIEADKTTAMSSLEAEVGRLASEIIRIVLQPALRSAPGGGRGNCSLHVGAKSSQFWRSRRYFCSHYSPSRRHPPKNPPIPRSRMLPQTPRPLPVLSRIPEKTKLLSSSIRRRYSFCHASPD